MRPLAEHKFQGCRFFVALPLLCGVYIFTSSALYFLSFALSSFPMLMNFIRKKLDSLKQKENQWHKSESVFVRKGKNPESKEVEMNIKMMFWSRRELRRIACAAHFAEYRW